MRASKAMKSLKTTLFQTVLGTFLVQILGPFSEPAKWAGNLGLGTVSLNIYSKGHLAPEAKCGPFSRPDKAIFLTFLGP